MTETNGLHCVTPLDTLPSRQLPTPDHLPRDRHEAVNIPEK